MKGNFDRVLALLFLLGKGKEHEGTSSLKPVFERSNGLLLFSINYWSEEGKVIERSSLEYSNNLEI